MIHLFSNSLTILETAISSFLTSFCRSPVDWNLCFPKILISSFSICRDTWALLFVLFCGQIITRRQNYCFFITWLIYWFEYFPFSTPKEMYASSPCRKPYFPIRGLKSRYLMLVLVHELYCFNPNRTALWVTLEYDLSSFKAISHSVFLRKLSLR